MRPYIQSMTTFLEFPVKTFRGITGENFCGHLMWTMEEIAMS